jgi:hypothetical protein
VFEDHVTIELFEALLLVMDLSAEYSFAAILRHKINPPAIGPEAAGTVPYRPSLP